MPSGQSCRGIGAARGEAEAGLRKTPLSFSFSEALAHRMLDPVVVGALVPAAAAAGRARLGDCAEAFVAFGALFDCSRGQSAQA
jgi:hypothetical protein